MAVKQAHERIIGERQVANDEKLLSLFEPDIHVIVRGKAGDPRTLREAVKDDHFAQAQHRRAQTEGRIAIFRNEFLGRPMRSEGFENRALPVAWGVLTHDLWVLAVKLREQRKVREQKLREAG